MSWLSKRWRAYRRERRFARCKYVHLMFNDKFTVPFVEFLNRNFDAKDHLVLCKRWFGEHPFPDAPNVIEMKSYAGVDFSRPNIRKVICHSLFDAEVVDILYARRDVLSQKAYWSIWGGDLYRAVRDAKNDFVRRNFRGCIFAPDREFALARYGMRDEFHDIILYAPIERSLLDVAKRETAPPGKVRVQVNNSCDESTLEMLGSLARFRGRITVTTVLSYGDLKWRTAVRDLGRELFGADFEVQDSFLSRPEYARYLASNDILILNQARQQGLGNTGAMLYLGKKVFIRSEISTYRYLRGRGMAVFDSHAVAGMDFSDFIGYADSDRAHTQRTADEVFFDDRSRAAGFRRLLEDS